MIYLRAVNYLIFFGLYLVFSVYSYAQNVEKCIVTPVKEPPFFITDTYKMKDKSYDNFREAAFPNKYISEPVSKIIYKRSLVTVLSEFIQRFPDWYVRTEKDTSNQFYIPVRLEASPHAIPLSSLETYNTHKLNLSRGRIDLELIESKEFPRAYNGDKGKINNNALLQPNGFYYFVSKNTTVFNEDKSELQILPENSVLSVSQNEAGEYLTCQNSCEIAQKDICQAEYLFDVVRLGKNWQKPMRIRVNPYKGEYLLGALRPIGNEYYSSIIQLMKEYEAQTWVSETNANSIIDQMQFISMTMNDEQVELRVKIPFEEELVLEVGEKVSEKEIDELTEEQELVFQYRGAPAAYNSWMYRPVAGNKSMQIWDVPSLYAYMDPRAACSFMYVLKKWSIDHPEPQSQIQWGEAGVPLVDFKVRESHKSGFVVDIRPQKKHTDSNGEYAHDFIGGITYKSKSRYDLDETKKLIDLIRSAGGIVLFNDTKNLNTDGEKRVHWVSGHNDHLHVSFAVEKESFDASDEEYLSRIKKMQSSCEELSKLEIKK